MRHCKELLSKIFHVFTCFFHLLHCIALLPPLTLHARLSVPRHFLLETSV